MILRKVMSRHKSMTHYEGPTKDNFGNQIIKHWPLVVFLAGFLVTWGVFSNRISTLEQKQAVIEAKQDKQDEQSSDLKADVAEIKAGIEFLKEAVKNK